MGLQVHNAGFTAGISACIRDRAAHLIDLDCDVAGRVEGKVEVLADQKSPPVAPLLLSERMWRRRGCKRLHQLARRLSRAGIVAWSGLLVSGAFSLPTVQEYNEVLPTAVLKDELVDVTIEL